MLGRELRREERLLSRTRVCVDRAGVFDELSEGGFRVPFPPSLARPESHMSLGEAGSTRQAHADPRG
jgi:hypothetical protein